MILQVGAYSINGMGWGYCSLLIWVFSETNEKVPNLLVDLIICPFFTGQHLWATPNFLKFSVEAKLISFGGPDTWTHTDLLAKILLVFFFLQVFFATVPDWLSNQRILFRNFQHLVQMVAGDKM